MTESYILSRNVSRFITKKSKFCFQSIALYFLYIPIPFPIILLDIIVRCLKKRLTYFFLSR